MCSMKYKQSALIRTHTTRIFSPCNALRMGYMTSSPVHERVFLVPSLLPCDAAKSGVLSGTLGPPALPPPPAKASFGPSSLFLGLMQVNWVCTVSGRIGVAVRTFCCHWWVTHVDHADLCPLPSVPGRQPRPGTELAVLACGTCSRFLACRCRTARFGGTAEQQDRSCPQSHFPFHTQSVLHHVRWTPDPWAVMAGEVELSDGATATAAVSAGASTPFAALGGGSGAAVGSRSASMSSGHRDREGGGPGAAGSTSTAALAAHPDRDIYLSGANLVVE